MSTLRFEHGAKIDGVSRSVVITTTNDPEVMATWLGAHGRGILGFDTESRPVFQKHERSYVSLVQLASADAVLVAHIGRACAAPARASAALGTLLSDASVTLCGMAVAPDVVGLGEALHLRSRPSCKVIDLKDESIKKRCNVKGGLDGLARALLSCEKWKSRALQLSRWDIWPLNARQIVYAAMDAWMGLQCLLAMDKLPAGRLTDFFGSASGIEGGSSARGGSAQRDTKRDAVAGAAVAATAAAAAASTLTASNDESDDDDDGRQSPAQRQRRE
jgi:hypothetical protein